MDASTWVLVCLWVCMCLCAHVHVGACVVHM